MMREKGAAPSPVALPFFIMLFSSILLPHCVAVPVYPGLYLRYEVVSLPSEDFLTEEARRTLRKFLGHEPRVLFSYQLLREGGDILLLGFGGAESAFIEVTVLRVGGGEALVNYSMALTNVTLYCSAWCNLTEKLLGISVKPRADIFWGGFPVGVWESPSLRFSKLLRVNLSSNEVLDFESGAGLGEWPFWLRREELSSNATFIWAGACHYCHFENYTMASLVYVDFNLTDARDYVVSGTRVNKGRTAVGLTHPALWTMRFYGVSAKDVGHLAEMYSAFSCRMVDYGNRTVDIDCSRTLERAKSLAGKPWSLGTAVFKYKDLVQVNALIVYRGSTYLAGSTEQYLLVFDRMTGVLLNASCAGKRCAPPPPFSDYLPRPDERRVLLSILPKFGMRLVDTNLPMEAPELGGPGRADETLHLCVVAAIAAAALLLGLPRWER